MFLSLFFPPRGLFLRRAANMSVTPFTSDTSALQLEGPGRYLFNSFINLVLSLKTPLQRKQCRCYCGLAAEWVSVFVFVETHSAPQQHSSLHTPGFSWVLDPKCLLHPEPTLGIIKAGQKDWCFIADKSTWTCTILIRSFITRTFMKHNEFTGNWR